MKTEVILTGTGMPLPDPERAGPGVLVRREGLTLQFDAGRATAMRLAAVGVSCPSLRALFITHHHSDHLTGVDDIVMSRWINRRPNEADDPLEVIAPEGPSTRFVERMLDHWREDLQVRKEHMGRSDTPSVRLNSFAPANSPKVVWSHSDVRVSAIVVRHFPVEPAVAYRIDTPEGAVVISGDTCVCPEVETISGGALVVVHEAMLTDVIRAAGFGIIADYHANAVEIGAMAKRLDLERLVLTHLIPPPRDDAMNQAFVDAVRRGGYGGEVVVGKDLTTVALGE